MVRQGPQQDSVHNAEDRRIRPYPEGKGQHYHKRETRVPREGSEGESQILQHVTGRALY
jgi:hypothetical protein